MFIVHDLGLGLGLGFDLTAHFENKLFFIQTSLGIVTLSRPPQVSS